MKFLIILFALALFAFMMVRPLLKGSGKSAKKPKKTQDDIEEMCQCTHCGVYASVRESFLADGLYFCSKKCLEKGAKQ
ncbi:PP0621 family protein [Helicobacter mastomyrinus]|uniref:PP0621 family protein n=1 Tax=Helicobacter mastomyrinus TaxID=287948 RepID=A0ABZ3F4C2_9HELI|nr:PP0621 family protein [uncultured Helicobacter sp.]